MWLNLTAVSARYVAITQFFINKAGFHRVAEQDIDNIQHALLKARVKKRCGNFDTIVDVSCHPVSGGEIHLLVTPVLEDIDPVMFKIAINDADNANIVADTFQIRDERAHSANQQIDRHAWTWGRIEAVNQTFIDQVIQF